MDESPEKDSGILWPALGLSLLFMLGGLYLLLSGRRSEHRKPVVVSPIALPSSQDYRPSALPVIACVDSEDSSYAWAGHTLSERVEQASHGQLKLKYASRGEVEGKNYDELSIVHEVQKGHFAMAIVTGSPLSNIDPDYEIFDLPFLFKDNAQTDRLLLGPVGVGMLNGLERYGLKGLGSMDLGFRIFTSSVPMPTLADFKGKRVRVMQTATGISMTRLLGSEPIPAPVERIIPMSKSGYIEAADRTYSTFYDFKGYEVHRFITETYHTHGIKILLANPAWFASLPQATQDAITLAAPEVSAGQRLRLRAEDEKAKRWCLTHGIKIFELSSAERERFRETCQPIYREYESLRGRTLIQDVK